MVITGIAGALIGAAVEAVNSYEETGKVDGWRVLKGAAIGGAIGLGAGAAVSLGATALGSAATVTAFAEEAEIAACGTVIGGKVIAGLSSMLAPIVGKVLNNRDSLLNSVSNGKLKNFVNMLYRPGAQIGSGSTADAIRYELQTGKKLLDGIGLQSHYDLNTTPEQIEAIYGDFAKTGKEIQITEADIMPAMISPTQREKRNSNDSRYETLWRKMYECAEKYGLETFTGWGVNDDLSWHLGFECTMIGKDGTPKSFAKDFIEKNLAQQKENGKNGLEDCMGDDRTRLSDVRRATKNTKTNTIGRTDIQRKDNEPNIE